ncbi:hypothetical protein KIL84_019396 [Mauremys mutica]|uniref:Uncharacterized protein n=1 Tax=Mauremys mutica TaxID=74926 RepID=A0A9D3XVJ7_9SAUR|nr:hypothetical protein KIL84_019396 [Mauremys mutica]
MGRQWSIGHGAAARTPGAGQAAVACWSQGQQPGWASSQDVRPREVARTPGPGPGPWAWGGSRALRPGLQPGSWVQAAVEPWIKRGGAAALPTPPLVLFLCELVNG